MGKTHLLALPDGHLSLEMSPEDEPKIGEAIRRLFGKPRIVDAVVSSTYSFGGEDFVYYYEWDDHCLISDSERGDAILKQLLAAVVPN